MIWLKAAPLLVLSMALLWTQWQRMKQQEKLFEADAQVTRLSESLMIKEQELNALQQQAKQNQQAWLTLQQQISSAHRQLRQRTAQMEQLKRENEQLRDWADTALPADIILLHQRPTVTGSEAYRQLSKADALPAAGNPATDQ